MDDAERAALNIKFEYERAKKLHAAHKANNSVEVGTMIHDEIELLRLRTEVANLKHENNKLRHEKLMLAHQSALQQMVGIMNAPLRDLANDIRAQQNVTPGPVFSEAALDSAFAKIDARQALPSMPKLIAKLTFRIVLVIGAAIVALAVIS